MNYVCQHCGHFFEEDNIVGNCCPLCGASCIRVDGDGK